MYVKSIIIYIIFINSIQTQGQTWQISNQCKEGQSYIDNSCRNCTVGKYSTNNIRSTCEYCTAGKFNDIEGATIGLVKPDDIKLPTDSIIIEVRNSDNL